MSRSINIFHLVDWISIWELIHLPKYSQDKPTAFGMMECGDNAVHSDFAFMSTCDVLPVTFLFFFFSFLEKARAYWKATGGQTMPSQLF